MNQLKKLIILVLLIQVMELKNLIITQKLVKSKIKITIDHAKYITTQEFNKLISEKVAARLTQANLASKIDTANFVNETDVDNKLFRFNKRINSNKTKYKLNFVFNKKY